MTNRQIADRLAAAYGTRAAQEYARWKVRSDPAYSATADALRGRTASVLDLGCGVGLMAFYLRESGHAAPIAGIDFDRRKIAIARDAARKYEGIEFIAGDAREPLPGGHDVVVLDILQYFDSASQQMLLANVARAAAADAIVVIRQGIRDHSWRYRFSAFVDRLGRLFRWMQAEALNFPTREEIERPFAGFDAEVRPVWGRTPFNNYLFVFRRRAGTRHPE